MKKKLLSGMAVVLMTFSMGAPADSDRQGIPRMMQSGGGGMPMMNMGAMQGQMNKMQQTMDRIHQSKSSNEQQELMQQHMGEMYKAMGMMGGMMSGQMGDGRMGGQMQGQMDNRRNMMEENDESMDLEAMRKRYNMMEQRMDMMQGMMGQLIEHMQQQQRMGTGMR